MYIAHIKADNATVTPAAKPLKKMTAAQQFAHEMAVKGRQRALKRHAVEIAEIQQYFPGWAPKFDIK